MSKVRDDSAWPPSAAQIALVLGPAALIAGLVVALRQESPIVALLAFLLGAAVGTVPAVFGMRRWLRGQGFPRTLAGILAFLASLLAVALSMFDPGVGGAAMAGMLGGLMSANYWAIRRARANRPAPPARRGRG